MKDLDNVTRSGCISPLWRDDAIDDDYEGWEDTFTASVDQLIAVDQLRAGIIPIRPAYDEA